VEYQQIAAVFVLLSSSTDPCGPGTVAGCGGGLVFGTLLGPEATGPGFLSRDLCFWFSWPDRSCTLWCVWGVWFGVVV
jgi:hypothetical protein